MDTPTEDPLFEDNLVLVVDSNMVRSNINTSKIEEASFVSFFSPSVDLTLPEKEGFTLTILKVAFNKIFAVYAKDGSYIMIVSDMTTNKQDTFELLTAVEEIFPMTPIYVVVVYTKRDVFLWNVSSEEKVDFESLGDYYNKALYHDGAIVPPILFTENKIGLPYEDGYFRLFNPRTDTRAAVARVKLAKIKMSKIITCIPYSNTLLVIVTPRYIYSVNMVTSAIERSPRYKGKIYEAIPFNENHVILAVETEEDYKIVVWDLLSYSDVGVLYVSNTPLHIAGITAVKHIAIITEDRYLQVINPQTVSITYSIDVLTNTLLAV